MMKDELAEMHNDQPMVSVIVPVYNAEKYLDKCITSIVNQTLADIEIILIDDGSTDSSGSICDSFARNDKRIQVVHQPNRGPGQVRNTGIAISKGAYVGFVDSDDYIEWDMYEVLLNAIKVNNAQIAICGRYIISDNGTTQLFTYAHEVCYSAKETIRGMLTYTLTDVSPCDKLFCRSILEGVVFPSGDICEDVAEMFYLVLNAVRVVHIGSPKYFNLVRKGSRSRSTYSPKTEGVFIYPNAVRDKILRVYPDLRKEADFYYYFNFLTGVSTVAKSSANKKYKDLRVKIRKYWPAMITAKWFTAKEKVLATLHLCNLYVIVYKVYEFTTRRKSRQ